MGDAFSEKDLRAELTKVMPGYKWTVHKSKFAGVMAATGIQSSGFNRLSTLHVERASNAQPWYTVKSAGFGAKSDWSGRASDGTLRRALRTLQDTYLREAKRYHSLAADLEAGRKVQEQADG